MNSWAHMLRALVVVLLFYFNFFSFSSPLHSVFYTHFYVEKIHFLAATAAPLQIEIEREKSKRKTTEQNECY